ncbi:lipid kinase, YegS/Rv2252/BmrU family [Tistlia consotensis]|uniref:Lipid kinase, YegS/Rv2252/BmrU family n=1 Tax=Tistlia consotensis USBA 355 TaxID=560819 RepID=A0A1Y6CHD1_9PROT|nr:diacylglycerol kinase family protein [Tistlia consotensis]SMF62308.1 lipid kinase, YegS/Rv2252/BmrU family [Tistlia consotensis USBA 355]SNR94510.1 lipid kinase, YegS/Rv2252/BmrU family [Tistlia consotensis]
MRPSDYRPRFFPPVSPAAGPLRLRIIHNPTAGGARWRRYGAVLERLDRAGARIEELATGRRGDAEAYAAALARDDCDRLVVAGGDGTINEAINGLLANQAGGRTIPLAILPLGTANVLAQEIGLSTRPAAVARMILQGAARPIALGEANGRAFTLMAGVGFDAHVVAQVDGRLKKRIGKLAYVWQTLRQLAVYDFPLYRVTVDGEVFTAASAVACNAHFYGGRYVLAPDALLDDPSLEVCLFGRTGRLHAVKYAAALLLGLLPRLPDYRIVTGRQVSIQGPAEDPIQGDGDILASLPAAIRVLPDALNLVFPPRR